MCLLDQPFPERDGLRVRVVDAEDLHAVADPQAEDLEPRVPETAPVLGLEVDVVDVLVLLGRVLGVLQGAVGAVEEPLGVLLQPRVVGRALQRDVERDLEAVLLARRDERVEVLERAQLRRDRLVAAVGGADPVDAARVARARNERVVLALAVGGADRVDRREVEDVEAQLGDLWDDLSHALEAAP